MNFTDTLVLDGTRKTSDGYLVVDAKVARTGIQVYSGREVGKPELSTVRVYRSPEEVFAKDTVSSFAHRPVTLGHPTEMVDAANWKKVAVGQVGGDVLRDGDFIRVPMLVMDAEAIAAVERGVKELSQGYTCDLRWEAGTAPNGEAYDARQVNIRNNHTAIVPAARGGPELRIGDKEPTPVKKIMFDGIEIEVTDQAEQAINKLTKQLSDAQAATGKAVADLAAANISIQTKDGEIAALKTQLTDASSPAKLDAAVAERTGVLDGAAKITGKTVDGTGKTVAAIRREAVAARLGDEAMKGLTTDAAIEGAFSALLAGVGGGAAQAPNPLATAIGDAKPSTSDMAARDEALKARDAELSNAWQPKAA